LEVVTPLHAEFYALLDGIVKEEVKPSEQVIMQQQE
jgi:hypothetical protein